MRIEGPFRRSRLAAGAIVTLAVAGCGSTSSPQTIKVTTAATRPARTAAGAPTRVTRAQFIAAADAICAAGRVQLAPLKSRLDALGSGQTLAEAAKTAPPLIGQAIAIEQASLAKLRALPEPAGDTATIGEWLEAVEEAIGGASNYSRALGEQDLNGAQSARETLAAASTREHGQSERYGLKCQEPE